MTLESMAAQVVHRVNPSGSHVTYDQLRKFLNVNYDRDSKCSVIYHCICYLLSYWLICFRNYALEIIKYKKREGKTEVVGLKSIRLFLFLKILEIKERIRGINETWIRDTILQKKNHHACFLFFLICWRNTMHLCHPERTEVFFFLRTTHCYNIKIYHKYCTYKYFYTKYSRKISLQYIFLNGRQRLRFLRRVFVRVDGDISRLVGRRHQVRHKHGHGPWRMSGRYRGSRQRCPEQSASKNR